MSGSVSRRAVLGVGAGLAAVPVLSGVARAGEGAARRTDSGAYISFTGGAFALVGAPVVVSAEDHPGVVRVAGDLRDDIERVTGVRPAATRRRRREVVLVGTIGRSPLIDGLVARRQARRHGHRRPVGDLAADRSWSARCPASTARSSSPAATSAARSSACTTSPSGIGVSPWYWWDDVPAGHRDALYVLPGQAHPGHAGGEVPRVLHQRREPGPRHLGARASSAPARRRATPDGFNARFYAQGLRGHAPPEGELPLAGGLGQGVRRGRPGEPRHAPTRTASSWARRTRRR